MSAPVLEVAALDVRYGRRTALTDLSLTAEPGSVLALAGPNGSGKSTLLRTIVGLERPAAGAVRVGGLPVRTMGIAERARAVSWMPQEEPPGDNLPVEEYVAYGRHPYRGAFGAETADDRRAVTQAIELVAASEFVGRRIFELSGGERQRVRLARVLAQEAPLVLLDEPTAHLDIGHQIELLARLREIAQERRTALLIALHDLNLAARFSDRILVLARGRRVALGAAREILSPELLAEVWGITAELRRDPHTDQPYLIPRLPLPSPRPAPAPADAGQRRRVHLLAGGGSGRDLIPALAGAGFSVSVGPVPLFDSDQEQAEILHLATVLEVPFAPFAPETLARTRELIRAADAVVVAPFPVGPGNLAVFEELAALPPSFPIVLYRQPAGRAWDFTAGRATELRSRLRAAHADEPATTEELIGQLRRLFDAGPTVPVAG